MSDERVKPASVFLGRVLPTILHWLVPLLFLVYTTLRAVFLSITHDEAGSFAIWTHFNIFTCRTNPDCWGSANLHWLYVFLMKGSVGLFGGPEWAIRLPALLGHVIYLFFSVKLVKWLVGPDMPGRPWLVLLGILLLNFNPYLLEFFGLARGYGLAVAMMLASVYYFARWTVTERRADLGGCFFGAFLAVMSNFTLLSYVACLCAVAGGIALVDYFQKKENKWRLLADVAGMAAVCGAVLYWLLRFPVSTLRKMGEFEYGAGGFGDTLNSIVRTSLYGVRYIKMYNLELFGGLMAVLLMAAAFLSVRDFAKKPGDAGRRFFLAAVLLPVLIGLATIVQHHLLGSQYLVNRTALLFLPLLALPVFLLAVRLLRSKKRGWGAVLAIVLGLFCTVHVLRAGQLQFTSEWAYDFQTRDMLEYLKEKLPPGKKIKLGVHWLYHPSGSYYLKTGRFGFTAEPLTYAKDLRLDGHYDYYYVQPSDMEALQDHYVLEKPFAWVGCLMRRKMEE